MKYCVFYHKSSSFRFFDEVDELLIVYRKEDVTLPDFLEQYKSKTIIMRVSDSADIERIKDLYSKYSNIKVLIDYYNVALREAVIESGLPFFFDLYIDSWDLLSAIIGLHPTDVYITNELGFELDKVAKVAHAENIQIRVFPNMAQSFAPIPDYLKFFIRPEDTPVYENYVDVFEFTGKEDQLSIYYKIYAKDKKWFGNLNEIIQDLQTDIDSRRILSAFATSRVKCGKRCLKGRPCRICQRALELSETLADLNLIITPTK